MHAWLSVCMLCFAVCAENYNFLQRVQDQPLLDMDEISMQIYSTVPAMNTVMVISFGDRQTDRETETETKRERNRQIDKERDRLTGGEREREREY